VLGWEQKIVWVSFSTTYRILKKAGLMTGRCHYHRHNGHSLPPTRRTLTGPNQRWCWDISYLLTYERGIFLYLYLLLDEYSRKALAWRISWQQTMKEARELLDDGMRNENILDLPEDQRPEVFNDRGRQMKAKPIQRMLEDMKMPQRFARPRTPNDNPFIEASFSTVKRDPEYPGRFRDLEAGYGCFNPYLTWYNQEHYHSGINYVTPDQAHRGLMDRIVAQRQEQRLAQYRRRREVNLRAIDVLR
jgi:putative transposase